jgi:hypothetical protein
LQHWEEKGHPVEAQTKRLRRFNDALKTGSRPREVFEQVTGHGPQKVYMRASEDKGKRRYHVGFMADKDGNVHTFFHTDRAKEANAMRKGKLLHGRD